jgi:hypothetical protein
MLLYWDQVSSIVPYDFIQNPESLGPYMQSLVREELVFQVIPGAHLREIPRFSDRFMTYVEGLGSEIDQRRHRFAHGSILRIHIEKLGNLGDAIAQRGLATSGAYPWYDMERDTADDFMSYLAASLGQIESVDSSPVTDKSAYLRRLALAGVPENAMERQLDSLRVEVLDQILPVPKHPVSPSETRAFKERHHQELRGFRLRVEREIVDAANVQDPALRARRLDLFFDEARANMEGIQEAMRGAGWETVKTTLDVIGAIPGVSPVVGLARAIWGAISGGNPRPPLDFAYAAHVGTELTPPQHQGR